MYIAAFVFEPGERDAEFHRLNGLIDDIARSIDGFVGAETWREAGGVRVNATYYWESLDALKEFSTHPRHMEAKRQYRKWYKGFHVVVSHVLQSYGDGAVSHLVPNRRQHRGGEHA